MQRAVHAAIILAVCDFGSGHLSCSAFEIFSVEMTYWENA